MDHLGCRVKYLYFLICVIKRILNTYLPLLKPFVVLLTTHVWLGLNAVHTHTYSSGKFLHLHANQMQMQCSLLQRKQLGSCLWCTMDELITATTMSLLHYLYKCITSLPITVLKLYQDSHQFIIFHLFIYLFFHIFTSGLRSRCTTPASCMKLTADTRLFISWLASPSANSFFFFSRSSSSPPRRSSMTMYVWNWERSDG